jgi:flagellin-like hook-associated protein FlgL
MALNVISNFAANTAHRNLELTDAALTSSLNKLSSGSRVVSAKDDAASLAIGSGLRADVLALQTATVNASQAGSLLQIADGAMANVGDILTRAKELAVQASSGQFSSTERTMFDNEYQSLMAEVDRISLTTTFAGNLLVNGTVNVQAVNNGGFYGTSDPNYQNVVSPENGFQSLQFAEDVASSVFRFSYDSATRGLTATNVDQNTSQTVILANKSIVPGNPEIAKFSQLGLTVTLNQLFNKAQGFPGPHGFDATATGGTVAVSTVPLTSTDKLVPGSDGHTITVTQTGHGLKTGDLVSFTQGAAGAPVTVGGVTLSGSYAVASVIDSNTYTIDVPGLSSTTSVAGTGINFHYLDTLPGHEFQNQYTPPANSGNDLGVTQTASELDGINITAAGPAFSRLPPVLKLQSQSSPPGFYIFGTSESGDHTLTGAFSAAAVSGSSAPMVTVEQPNHGLQTGDQVTLKSPVTIPQGQNGTGGTITLEPGTYVVTVPAGSTNTYEIDLTAAQNAPLVAYRYPPVGAATATPTNSINYAAINQESLDYTGKMAASGDAIAFTYTDSSGATTTFMEANGATDAAGTTPTNLSAGLSALVSQINADPSVGSLVTASTDGVHLFVTQKDTTQTWATLKAEFSGTSTPNGGASSAVNVADSNSGFQISFTDSSSANTGVSIVVTGTSDPNATPPTASNLPDALGQLVSYINTTAPFKDQVTAALNDPANPTGLILTSVTGQPIPSSFATTTIIAGATTEPPTAYNINLHSQIGGGTSSGTATVNTAVNLTDTTLQRIQAFASNPSSTIYPNLSSLPTDPVTGLPTLAPMIVGSLVRNGNIYTAQLRDMTLTSQGDQNLVCTITFSAQNAAVTTADTDYGAIDLRTLSQSIGANSQTTSNTKTFDFKLGDSSRDTDVLKFNVDAATTSALNLKGTSISTLEQAKAASAAISDAIVQLSSIRANIGASQNRLDFASSSLNTAIQNTEAARSNLLDLDIASEMTTFTSKQILMQAGVAMLAQANEIPQTLLRLFQKGG